MAFNKKEKIEWLRLTNLIMKDKVSFLLRLKFWIANKINILVYYI